MRPAWCGLRSGKPNPVVCGRKFCSACGRWRLVATEFDLQRTRGKLRLRSWCRTCQARSNRRSVAARSQPRRAAIEEYGRIWYEMQRRRAGIPPRNWAPATDSKGRQRTLGEQTAIERALLDRETLIDELRRRVKTGETTIAALTTATHMPAETLHAVLAAANEVRLEEIDRVICAEFISAVA